MSEEVRSKDNPKIAGWHTVVFGILWIADSEYMRERRGEEGGTVDRREEGEEGEEGREKGGRREKRERQRKGRRQVTLLACKEV